ncbi:MAG: bifunctional methylenetetrahydrofolate dehydrogenase/methenyltetrahydrofolate cyclohydrolase FolD [Ruminococcaceae bacterium]|nr:bifunctional methylenetetrahydrofolate dehydrogenase/methenyltetrahydrofolate cyclohydrolase FolD [Oscillospiraceae bacterium]
MSIIMSGKEVSANTRAKISDEVKAFKEERGITPGLAVIIVGNNEASKVYVRNKHKACEDVGMYSKVIEMPEETAEEELLSLIDSLNKDDEIHGILVQLPLPKHIDEQKVINSISPKKDVDAFHPENVGKIMIGEYDFLPCTPAGVMEILDYYNIEISGKKCVIVGRSNIVGKPQALLLLEKNGTVTICHSRTKDLKEETKRADILVVAIGKPDFITADMVKEGAVVVDVGINRMPDGKLHGDVNFDEVAPKSYAITPVPGGVGPMTITMLLKNTLTAAKKYILTKG